MPCAHPRPIWPPPMLNRCRRATRRHASASFSARGNTTQVLYDAALMSKRTADAKVVAAQAALQTARDRAGYTELVADRNGVVTSVGADAGQVVEVGEMVVRVAQPEEREAVFNVAEAGVRSAPKEPVIEVALAGAPDITAVGRVREVSPQADPVTRTHTVRIALENPPDALRLGATVTGRLKQPPAPVVELPGTAIVQEDERSFVWVVDPQGPDRQASCGLDPARTCRRAGRRHRWPCPGRHRRHRRSAQPCGRPAGPAWEADRNGGGIMTGFNLSEWALRHRSFTWYLILSLTLAGAIAYTRLGREEDPAFAIKTMVVQTAWPGATIDDTIDLVTDPIEKKLEEVPYLDYVKSYTRPGFSVVYVNLKDYTPAGEIPDLWYQVRKKIADMKGTLPQGIQGPVFNDEFGDTFGTVYAFTADGFSYRELKDYAETARAELMRVPDVGKIQFVGIQNEKIYLDFSTRQLAALGIDRDQIVAELQAQNAVAPAGVVQAGDEKVTVRVSGEFTSEESLRAINLRADGKFYRLADLAQVRRGYADPPSPIFRYNGEPAIGMIISMAAGGNVLEFGEGIHERMRQVEANLPVGINTHLVANQSVVVEHSVAGFTKALKEAVIIVLVVSFISLGIRAGIVVACSIPLVLAMTFIGMEYYGIALQRISLGALIIALGLLVDDAMITVEMMITKLEEGFSLDKAATFAYTSTAFPMLTGTLITVAGFIPIGFAQGGAAEYCFSLFAVVAMALLFSWIVAVMFAPLIGVKVLRPPDPKKQHAGHGEPGRLMRAFRGSLRLAMRARYLVIIVTVALFGLSVFGLRFVQQQFFPASDRSELLVNLTLPQTSSIKATRGSGGPVREGAGRRPGDRQLELLHRPGRHPVLSALGRPARQRLLRPGRGGDQGIRRPRRRPGAAGKGAERGLLRPEHAREPAGDGAAGRLADPVPGFRTGCRRRCGKPPTGWPIRSARTPTRC